MPIKVPNNLPAVDALTKENVFVMTDSRAMTQDIRPLHIVLLNLMPTKIDTETQLTRLLGNTPLQIELELLQMSSHESHNISEDHMIAFYKTFDAVKDNNYDGLIITGAPVEMMEFEEVDYWEELCEIMEWAEKHVHSTFFICWGAQAGLYYHYGIQKRLLPKKLSGVYKHHLDYRNGMLFRGFDDEFYVPHSRNTTVDRADIEAVPELKIISSSEEAGVFCVKSEDDRKIFVMGHSEYDGDTLLKEYVRDVKAGINPEIPVNYFPDDDDTKEPLVRWRSCANLLYSNWLNYFVYQSTPYDIKEISQKDFAQVPREEAELTVAKFGGSSLADAGQFRKVRAIVEADKARKYIVVSAPGKNGEYPDKMTDLLIGSTGSMKKFAENMDIIEKRFQDIIDELGIDLDIHESVDEIRSRYRSGVTSGIYLSSRGEYLCAKVLAAYLGYDFVDAAEMIRFNYEGKLDKETTRGLIAATLKDHERAVIPGFYGTYENGVIHTFSRGGSDITGSLVADAIGADLYENWTDVPGMLLADPKLIENALPVPVITYRELRELSLRGATVLHEDAVAPVRRTRIPINIRSTNEPDAPGTMIVGSADGYKSMLEISGITGRTGYACITIVKENLNEDPAFRTKIIEIFERHKIKIYNQQASVDILDIVVDDKYLQTRYAMLEHDIMNETCAISVKVSHELAVISVVGRNISSSPMIGMKVFEALAQDRINVAFVDHAAGSPSMTVGVDEKDFESAVIAIYREFSVLNIG